MNKAYVLCIETYQEWASGLPLKQKLFRVNAEDQQPDVSKQHSETVASMTVYVG